MSLDGTRRAMTISSDVIGAEVESFMYLGFFVQRNGALWWM